jgi:hypothetical protein
MTDVREITAGNRDHSVKMVFFDKVRLPLSFTARAAWPLSSCISITPTKLQDALLQAHH